MWSAGWRPLAIRLAPIAEEDRLRSREREFAGADGAAQAPLQLVFPLRLIPRLRPVVERRCVVTAEAYWNLVLTRFRGWDSIF